MSVDQRISGPDVADDEPGRFSADPPAGPADPERISPPWNRRRIELTILTVVMIGVSIVSIRRMQIAPDRLIDGVGNMWNLFWGINRPSGIWPPRFDELGVILSKTVETIFMAILATFMAAVLSFPLAFFAARNTTPHPALRTVSRAIIAGGRTIPDLIFAAIFVRAFAIGPAAGVLAIALHSIGMLGKLLADAIEEVDLGQREGVSTTGASWLQQMSTGILPQVTPTYLGVCLYRFDINFRSSTILGLVGAGGIGELLNLYKGSLRWDLFMGVVVFIIITVLFVEWISVTARKLILGHDQAGERRRRTPLGRINERLGRHVVSVDEFMPAARTSVVDMPEPEPVALPAAPTPALRPPWTPDRVRLSVVSALLGLLIATSVWLSGVSWSAMAKGFRPTFSRPDPGELPSVWYIAQRLVPRSFDWWSSDIQSAMLDTIAMGIASTAMGLPFAMLFGYLGARNIAPNLATYRLTRFIQVVLRAIPEVVIAILLVSAVGLGVFPGVVALTIGVVAVGAKFFSDALEIIDDGPRDGVRSVGATRMQETATAVTPQFVPNLVGNGLYLLDIMIRSSTIVGIFGAGGIGFILFSATRLLEWEVLGGLLIMIFVVVFAIERLSDWVRKRII